MWDGIILSEFALFGCCVIGLMWKGLISQGGHFPLRNHVLPLLLATAFMLFFLFMILATTLGLLLDVD